MRRTGIRQLLRYAIVFTMALALTAGSLAQGAAAAGTEGPTYRVGTLTVRDADDHATTEIPAGSFVVTVPVTKLTAGGDVLVIVSAYGAGGQFLGMKHIPIEQISVGTTVNIRLRLDHSEGTVESLKAFAVTSFSNPTPVGPSRSFLASGDDTPTTGGGSGAIDLPIDLFGPNR